MTLNAFLVILLVFLSGMIFDNWLCGRILRPWARHNLGRPLEQDLWGLKK
jgi:hypothetical protein